MPHLDEGTLHALLDGELEGTEVMEIQAHLGSCASCGSRLKDIREFMGEAEMAYFKSIATIITGFVNDMPPKVAIELARRGLSSDMRPSQTELEALLKSAET